MNGGWGFVGGARALVLTLALLGLLYLFFSARGGQGSARLSLWAPRADDQAAGASIAGAAPSSGGLVGTTQQTGRGFGGEESPQGNPLQAANTVMTQGYGVGSHAPAAIWGAVDLAIDGNGDGSADPDGSLQHPVYATHAGVVALAPNSWPAGNHIWVSNSRYRTGYSHLAGFAVDEGQAVRAGDLIGYIGSTGQSSGPHLDYQVWAMEGGAWVNKNPLDFGALDGVKK
jgi:murein DD-endopeptidase MepM/ murein hydrolase activator NlpD